MWPSTTVPVSLLTPQENGLPTRVIAEEGDNRQLLGVPYFGIYVCQIAILIVQERWEVRLDRDIFKMWLLVWHDNHGQMLQSAGYV